MKPFFAYQIGKIIKGTIIKGEEDLLATYASAYVEMIEKPNTLLFLRRKWRIKWDIIKVHTPCIVVTDEKFEELSSIDECTVILVEDVKMAYWTFVDYYRSLFNIPVVAVTGTCGKSTTKDMIKHILSERYNVKGTFRSANGRTMHFGYLTEIDRTTDAAVFETPVGEPGDLDDCCRYFKPTIGIITNIGVDHLSSCKTLENYINAKAEIVRGIDKEGVLILNCDDENIKKIDLSNFKGRIIYFGVEEACDFKAFNIRYVKDGMKFKVVFQSMKFEAFIPGYGTHQVYNALAAIAAVHEMGIGINEAVKRLCSFKNLPLHLNVYKGLNNSLIINDSWSINPSSLRTAIDVLGHLAKGRKRIALIGDMDELGESSLEIHRQVGVMIARMDVLDMLIAVGPMASEAARAAKKEGFRGNVFKFQNTEGVPELLRKKLNKNTILLIKSAGSRDPQILDLDL